MNFLKKILSNLISKISSFLDNSLRPSFTRFINNIIPDKDITKTSILFWFMAGFIIIAIFWSLLAKIETVVRAQGEVIPASKIKVVQSAYGGIIEKINVKLGDKVKKDDVLFVIDAVRAESEFLSNERAYEATLLEVETRLKKIDLIEDLVNQGAEAEMRLLEEKLTLVDSQRRLAQLEAQRASLKQQKDQTEIKAPYDGTINDVNVTTSGEVIQGGQILANLVPDGEKFLILAQVDPRDISFISNGQKAKLSFSAFDPSVYGTFNGQVIKVAATTTKRDNQRAQELIYYDTRIEVDDPKINEIQLQSGMTVDVNIIGQERTVLGYIFDPVTKIKRQAFREK